MNPVIKSANYTSEDLRKLRGIVGDLKDASMFNLKPVAEAALDQALVCLFNIEKRLERIENGKA